MAAVLHLDDVRAAWEARDPRLIRLVEQFATQSDPPREQPIRDGALTFDKFLSSLKDWRFRKKSKEEQAHYRQETLKALEAPSAEVPLPDRLRSHEIIITLWQSDDPLARDYLLRIIAAVPLVYGPWKALKRIFKEAEAKHDTEVYGALAARFDMAFAARYGTQVSGGTLAYCVRRAWRYLRRVAVQLPATYADVASDFLVRYADNTNWRGTWVSNHIFFHGTKKYGRANFRFGYRESLNAGQLKFRAYPELWQRSPRPLFSLLERAQADQVRDFATAALKADFRQVLRDIEAGWVVRLVGVPSRAIHDFVVWLLQNVPKFEQGAFRTLGLHDAVLRLLDSPSNAAREYAAGYARTHARDLPVPELVRLANNSHDAVRKLARDLLGEKDPRTGVGLEAWGHLLETDYGHKYAADVITKSFGRAELTPEWFEARLLSGSEATAEFVSKLLPKVHDLKVLGPGFFVALIRKLDPEHGRANRAAVFASEELGKFDLNALPADDLRWLALFPRSAYDIDTWIDGGKLRPQALGVDFLKMLAFAPDWDADPWLVTFRAANGEWAKELTFDEGRAQRVLNWFADVRKFTPAEVGMDWLLRLVARSEPLYHDFARERLIRTFVPADFAPAQNPPTAVGGLAAVAAIDLNKASFVFTGKLATMTREVAEGMVKDRNGTVSGSVSAKLHYLVIGDDGSPLLGQGAKSSKQTKAEEVNEKGGNIRIISETMFLRMLSGAPATASADATTAGCERLWDLLVAPGPADGPVGRFAREYLRRHHPDIGAKLGGKPVDPGADVPRSFLSFDRVFPLFRESRKPLREFALELAGWEMARWNPGVDELIGMSEIPFMDIRRFVAKALLADDTPPNRPFRLNPEKLEPAAAYRFCEAGDEETRALGMELIRRLPKLRVPEELYRLAESPDRKVRAFVIHALWAVYRDRGLTPDWKPPVPPQPTVGAKAKKAAEQFVAANGDGVPHRPEQWPAERPSLAEFLRRVLFELPPGRPEKSRETVEDAEPTDDPKKAAKPASAVSTKPLPARRAKLDLVEVMRDLALDEKDFAGGVLPLLDEFLQSRGRSEREACLVAVTRIRHQFPELKKAGAV